MRLLRFVARFVPTASGRFLTYTYRENMQDHKRAKHELDLLLRWLKNHYPEGAYLWRMEYQKRGAIHFHIIAFNVGDMKLSEVTDYWQGMTGDDSYPDVKRIENKRKATYYVSKYIAKTSPSIEAAPTWMVALCVGSWRLLAAVALVAARDGFINLTYSENENLSPVFIGRFWGIVNRKNLPMAVLHKVRIKGGADVLHEMRRYARRYAPVIGKRLQGFTLFVQSPSQWLRLLDELLDESWIPHEVVRESAFVDF